MATLTAARPLDRFSYVTFDVVGTLIDFETGLLDAFRRIGGAAPDDRVRLRKAAGRANETGGTWRSFRLAMPPRRRVDPACNVITL